ncbi:MAG: VTT domain-containing protein [Herpetosiphon sp.]
METLKHLLSLIRNPEELIRIGGYLGMSLIVFAETGLLVGFFLPGDSLLVTAGLLAKTVPSLGLHLLTLNLLLIPAAIIGDAVGYYIGRSAGRSLFQREDSRFFKRKYLIQTQQFYERHGNKTIVLARFVPIVRTFAPVVAGVAGMSYRNFVTYNVLGGIGWVAGMTGLGYSLGAAFPWIGKRIEVLAIVIIFISLIPLFIEYLRHRGQTPDGTAVAARPDMPSNS